MAVCAVLQFGSRKCSFKYYILWCILRLSEGEHVCPQLYISSVGNVLSA